MKKIFLFLIILCNIHLFATDSIYRIKLNSYTNKNNALRAIKNTRFDTYMLKTSKYYGHYTGNFRTKKEALSSLRNVKRRFKNAYLVKTTQTTKPLINKPHKVRYQSHRRNNNLQIGKTLYAKGDYDGAFIKFDQLLINEPNNHLARLEYARTLYMLGFYTKSADEFTTVLRANPPQVVQDNINIYLKKIANKTQTKSFGGSIGVALNYDDNLNYNTDDAITTYGALELQNDTNKTAGFYETIDLTLYYLYISDYLNWTNRLYTYNEFQNENIKNLNFLNYTTSLSKQFKRFEISLPFSVSNVWLEGKTYSFKYLIKPTINITINKTTSLSVSLKHQQTNIKEGRCKDYTTNGIRTSFLKTFNPITIQTSFAYEQDRRKTKKRYDISKDKVLLSTNIYYRLFKNTLIGFGGEYNIEDYIELDPVLGYTREDKKYNFNTFIKQQLSKNGFTTLSYQLTQNNSNINTYNYKKNNCTLSYNHNF